MGQVHSNPNSFKSSEQIKEDGHGCSISDKKIKDINWGLSDILKKLEGMEEESVRVGGQTR